MILLTYSYGTYYNGIYAKLWPRRTRFSNVVCHIFNASAHHFSFVHFRRGMQVVRSHLADCGQCFQNNLEWRQCHNHRQYDNGDRLQLCPACKHIYQSHYCKCTMKQLCYHYVQSIKMHLSASWFYKALCEIMFNILISQEIQILPLPITPIQSKCWAWVQAVHPNDSRLKL